MNAVRWTTGGVVAPFGELASELPILGVPLAETQRRALEASGVAFVDRAPEEPWLAVGDHLWVTPELVRRFLDACPPTGGQLAIGGLFFDATSPLQRLDEGRLPLWLVPGGVATPERLAALPRVEVDLDVRPFPTGIDHPAFAGVADRPVPVTDAMAHTLRHWTHLSRINLYAWIAWAEGERRRVESGPWWGKLWAILGLAWRARSLDPRRWAAAAGKQGKNCRIHPTASVEGSVLGDGVEVGAHAVVRHSWLGDGVNVGDHVRVQGSVVMERAVVSRGANAHLTVLLPGAYLSEGVGHQACIVGRDAFIAAGVTMFDLHFDREIRVWDDGERVSSGTRFLGPCIGHRAKIGAQVRLGYGVEVPNDAFLIADPETVVRDVAPGSQPQTAVRRRADS